MMVDLPKSTTVTLSSIAKMIDHSLLHPTMTDAEISTGLSVAAEFGVATACVKPYSITQAIEALKGTSVGICPVIGFPHGNSTTEVKRFEAIAAVKAGGTEIDMVVNIGKVLGEDWEYVEKEVKIINDAITERDAILKVIFENDYLENDHIKKLCEICSRIGVAFIKTSTGFGFVKQKNGLYDYAGATLPHLRFMRKHAGKHVKIKAAGGIRTLDELIRLKAMGIDRVGASATVAIMEEAKKRGIGVEPLEVDVVPVDSKAAASGGY